MDWLTKYQTIDNFSNKKVTVKTPKGIKVQFYGKNGVKLYSTFLSAIYLEEGTQKV